ncbi:MAG: hypothetical protein ACQ9MH_13500 [Nitrospinales bacterium]
MILGLEDIPGGSTAYAFLVWLVLTALFYLVCYMAALNVIDDISKNRLTKFPMTLVASIPTAVIMSIFSYKPFVLFFLMAFSNFFRVKKKASQASPSDNEQKINLPLHYSASYLYIVLVVLLTLYIQNVYAPTLPSID